MSDSVAQSEQAAIARFEAYDASDPRGAADSTVSERYHRRLAHWVDALSPRRPSLALRLAARCQHTRRWTIPRRDYPDGRSGYRRWRSDLSQMHAQIAAEVLRATGHDQAIVERVGALLLKRNLATDEEVQLFEDAICVTFIEGELDAFVSQHDDDKMVRILRKTWNKMSPAGHAAASDFLGALGDRTRRLLALAIQPPDPP